LNGSIAENQELNMMKSLSLCVGLFLFSSVSLAGAQVCPGLAGLINLVGPVTGAPFTADYVHAFEAVNADGSRNHQQAHGKLYRDSEGRARCDIENGTTGKTRFVIISDPVANVSIRMNLQQQTARVTHYPRSSSPFAPSAPPQNTETKDPVNVLPQVAHTEEDLGSKEMERFTATGKRYINTATDGHTSTTEDWYSADLKFKLLTDADSPFGHLRDELNNISKGNPDPSVFQVPGGFTVRDLYCRENRCGFDSP
jgi:hypothetical protein